MVARQGFAYQDHVAVAFYLQMLANPQLASVWCEADDDITLIWQVGGDEAVEFVQVKNEQFDQLWTIAKICEGDGRALETDGGEMRPASLLEKSLDHDRCAEPCSFRIVTSRQLHSDLAVLAFPLAHAYRAAGHEVLEPVVTKIVQRAERDRRFVSANRHDAAFWVHHVIWDVRESAKALENANLLALDAYVAAEGGFIAPDQRGDLYTKLLLRAKTAADAPYDPDPTRKKLARAALLDYVREEFRKAEHPSLTEGALRSKMEAARLPEETIESAWDSRRRYRASALSSTYLMLEDREVIEGEVQARLNDLLSAWNANEFADTPEEFHSRCLKALDELRVQLPCEASKAMLQGAMYDITARCRHRFTRFSEAELPPIGTGERSEAA